MRSRVELAFLVLRVRICTFAFILPLRSENDLAMNTEVIRKDWVGRVIDGRFRLLEWMGSSGQAGVFLCELDGKPEQKAAIKLFPSDVDGAAACAAGWSVAAGLDHPNLIRVLQTGRDKVDETGVLYVVTEYAGEVLSGILPERPLTADETKQMLEPTINALEYLHDRGLVHGRLKPTNIMVVDERLKLSAENIRGATTIAPVPRTLDIYDAPERAAGKISPASDLWSLGVTVVESLTRIPPAWNRSSETEPMVPPSVPNPFAQIARECLRQDATLRCTLDEISESLATGAAVPHRSAPNEKRPVNGRRRMVIGAAAAVVVAVLAFVMLRSHHAGQTATASQSSTRTTSPAPATTPGDSGPTTETTSPALEAAPPATTQTPAPTTQQVAPTQPSSAPAAAQSASPAQQDSKPAQQNATQPHQNAAMTAAPVAAPPTPPPAVAHPAQSGTSKGAVAQKVMPEIPARAIHTINGTVKVGIKVNVDPSGAVSDASIASQGPSKYFADLALKAAQGWKFEPAVANGQPVSSVWQLRFKFRRSGTEVVPLEENP